ncbi:MAG: helix-turn-helix domain-containing protein, partial [Candidatus Latescibacteria bacterium]|nr:helix-turn-helix domain-containing protein [Candidatus Latescibacterota bacterium]
DWPGNVREVENVIEHAVALARGRLITIADLPVALSRTALPRTDPGRDGLAGARLAFETAQERLYLEALKEGGGDVPRAAQLLGVSRATLYRRLRKHGLTEEVPRVRYENRN